MQIIRDTNGKTVDNTESMLLVIDDDGNLRLIGDKLVVILTPQEQERIFDRMVFDSVL